MLNLITFITDSQTKIFHDSEVMPSIERASVLSNEPYSFTYAYKLRCGDCVPISVSVIVRDSLFRYTVLTWFR